MEQSPELTFPVVALEEKRQVKFGLQSLAAGQWLAGTCLLSMHVWAFEILGAQVMNSLKISWQCWD